MMNFEEKTSNKVEFSEEGSRIEPGQIFFEGDIHGRVGKLTSLEYERMLGLRDVSTDERKKLASKGQALSDGSFPIASCKDASNAIHRIGTTNHSKSEVVAHIRKMVKKLGCTGSIFENYK